MLAALLQSTLVVGVSQNLHRSTGGRHLYSVGRPYHVWHWLTLYLLLIVIVIVINIIINIQTLKSRPISRNTAYISYILACFRNSPIDQSDRVVDHQSFTIVLHVNALHPPQCESVSSFLMAHQHIIGHSVP